MTVLLCWVQVLKPLFIFRNLKELSDVSFDIDEGCGTSSFWPKPVWPRSHIDKCLVMVHQPVLFLISTGPAVEAAHSSSVASEHRDSKVLPDWTNSLWISHRQLSTTSYWCKYDNLIFAVERLVSSSTEDAAWLPYTQLSSPEVILSKKFGSIKSSVGANCRVALLGHAGPTLKKVHNHWMRFFYVRKRTLEEIRIRHVYSFNHAVDNL